MLYSFLLYLMAFFFKTKAERNNLKFYIEWQKKNPITHYHSLYNTLSLSQHWETTSLLSVSIDHKELLKNCGKTYMTQNVPF